MMIRTAFVFLFLAVAGCAHSGVLKLNARQKIQFADSKTMRTDPQVASPDPGDSNSFDPAAHEKVVNEREAAVIADYIGLTATEASELARKQSRMIAMPWVDGKPQGVTAIYAPGRIFLTIDNGVVTDAELPSGVDVGFISRSTTPRAESEVASPVQDNSNDFDPSAHIEEVDERKAAIISDYIGLTFAEASELASKQNRKTAVSSLDGKPQAVLAIYTPGRISLTIANGVVTHADFPCGVDVGFTGR